MSRTARTRAQALRRAPRRAHENEPARAFVERFAPSACELESVPRVDAEVPTRCVHAARHLPTPPRVGVGARIASRSKAHAFARALVVALAGCIAPRDGGAGPIERPPFMRVETQPDARAGTNDRHVRFGWLDTLGAPRQAVPRCPTVSITAPPPELALPPFYRKYVNQGGVAIVGSERVSDAAFRVAYHGIATVLRGRACERRAIANAGIRFAILARDEVPTDLPEYRDLYDAFPGIDWNGRYAGFSATPMRPVTVVREGSLVPSGRDPWWFGESVIVHEAAHTLFQFGAESLNGGDTLRHELQSIYEAGQAEGLWTDTYASTNADELFAEAVQDFLDANNEASPADGMHCAVNTREELAEHDGDLAQFVADLQSSTRPSATCSLDSGEPWRDPTANDVEAARICSEPTRARLRPIACDEAAEMRSSPVNDEFGAGQIHVYNRNLGDDVRVYYVDPSGARVDYGRVPARTAMAFHTNASQRWLVTDARGNCLGVYAPRPGIGWAFVEPQP